MKRRNFVFLAIAGGSSFIIGSKLIQNSKVNDMDEYLYIKTTLTHMLSSSTMPSLSSLNTLGYFKLIQADMRISQSKKDFIFSGARWVNESSFEMFDRDFLLLSSDEKETLLQDISMYKWGDNWLYNLYTFYFESMFSDPLYGSNINKIGWKHLDFEPGFPRPTKVNV